MPEHYIAFWNVENLFDVSSATEPDRPEWLQRALKGELKGWTQAVLTKKLKQIGSIIRRMNGGIGPDILGVSEIENRRVLDRLVAELAPLNRPYGIAHADMKDKRGIDVAFFYDTAKYEIEKNAQGEDNIFNHYVQKRTATRDLFQVNFIVKATVRDLILIGNHWPSRSGGRYESEPYRIMVGETLSYFHERIREIKGKDVAIVALGDFNDEPGDRAVEFYAKADRDRTRVVYAQSPKFWNLMWPLLGEAGTHYYGGERNILDQIWVSRGIAKKNAPFEVADDGVRIEAFEEMVEDGRYPGPRRFGRPSKLSDYDPDGFSDHFPVSVRLIEKD